MRKQARIVAFVVAIVYPFALSVAGEANKPKRSKSCPKALQTLAVKLEGDLKNVRAASVGEPEDTLYVRLSSSLKSRIAEFAAANGQTEKDIVEASLIVALALAEKMPSILTGEAKHATFPSSTNRMDYADYLWARITEGTRSAGRRSSDEEQKVLYVRVSPELKAKLDAVSNETDRNQKQIIKKVLEFTVSALKSKKESAAADELRDQFRVRRAAGTETIYARIPVSLTEEIAALIKKGEAESITDFVSVGLEYAFNLYDKLPTRK